MNELKWFLLMKMKMKMKIIQNELNKKELVAGNISIDRHIINYLGLIDLINQYK